jgi:CBS domain containing-hemolysin-like protein
METTTAYLLVTMALVLVNAFFVAAEFAIVRVRPTYLEQLASSGNSRAASAVKITHRIDAYISANQLGMTLCSLGIGWLGEPTMALKVYPYVEASYPFKEGAAHAISVIVALFILTVLTVVVGELAPKTLAIRRTVPVALWTAQPVQVFYLVAWPIIWLMKNLASIAVRLIGLRPTSEAETQHTAEELRLILSRSPGMLDSQIRQMLVRILDYQRRKARHVMTVAADVVVFSSHMSIAEATKVALETRYTRFPVVHRGSGRVLGFVHMQDLFAVFAGRRKATRLVEVMREPLYATPNTPLDRLRLEMQQRQLHLAIINGPDGVFSGIVTLEDLIEEIVGEIRDESDEEVAPIARRDDVVEASGRVLLDDLERETGIKLLPPEPEAETVAGYVTKRLGAVAKVGDRVECEGHLIIVTEAAQRRVLRVRIVPHEKEPEELSEESA